MSDTDVRFWVKVFADLAVVPTGIDVDSAHDVSAGSVDGDDFAGGLVSLEFHGYVVANIEMHLASCAVL